MASKYLNEIKTRIDYSIANPTEEFDLITEIYAFGHWTEEAKNTQRSFLVTVINDIIAACNADQIKFILTHLNDNTAGQSQLNTADDSGYYPIHHIFMNNSRTQVFFDIIEFICDNNIDVDFSVLDNNGYNIFHYFNLHYLSHLMNHVDKKAFNKTYNISPYIYLQLVGDRDATKVVIPITSANSPIFEEVKKFTKEHGKNNAIILEIFCKKSFVRDYDLVGDVIAHLKETTDLREIIVDTDALTCWKDSKKMINCYNVQMLFNANVLFVCKQARTHKLSLCIRILKGLLFPVASIIR